MLLLPLLLASTIAERAAHLPVHQTAQPAQPVVAARGEPQAPQEGGEDKLAILTYCDVSRQPTITVTNVGPTALVVAWTMTATMPPYPPDSWSNVSRLEPGQFEGWMSPAEVLHLDVKYDDDGQPATNSIDASCPVPAGEGSGLAE